MERLFTYWIKHCPGLTNEDSTYIRGRSTLRRYEREQVIKLETDPFPFFCIVLSGLVAGYRKNSEWKSILCELMGPMDYFTGTQHPFTPRLRDAQYIAMEDTTLLFIRVAEAREAQRRLQAFSELIQVMKQRKINFLELLIALDNEPGCYPRYRCYMKLFGEQAKGLPPHMQWQILRMSRPTYYRMKARYLRDKRKP